MSSEEEGESIYTLKPGTEVSSSKATYIVDKLLGEGGFGMVYKVKHAKTHKLYAMKIEQKIENKASKLKMEILILKLVSEERKNSHFTTIVDRAKKDTYFFLVMELAGPSLADLKKKRERKHFTVPTGLSVSQQCLEACEDLHKYGFIHRDLKPANFACGTETKKHIIYILDFGIARKILNDKNELKTPRVTVRFKGTLRFACLSCHYGREMGWKDDCESWFYMMVDITCFPGLPWGCGDKGAVCKLKEEARNSRELLFGLCKCAKELEKILFYIDRLQYQDRVDYQYIYKLLAEACAVVGGSMDAPYDWE